MANIYKAKGNLMALRGNLVKLDARDPFMVKINTQLGNGFNSFTLPLTNLFKTANDINITKYP
jgi:hypothetical protein